MVGYTLFGGVGLLGRKLGLAADAVVSAEVVTADGQWAEASADRNPQLFWALRGGGGGFAVVSRLHLALGATPELFGGQLLWPAELAADVLHGYRDWTDGLPEQLTSIAAMVELPPLPDLPADLRGRRVVGITVCFAGAAKDARQLIAPLRAVAPPMVDSCRPITPAELAGLHGVPELPLPTRIHADLLACLPPEAIDRLVDLVASAATPLLAFELRHLGGAYARPVSGHGVAGPVTAPYLMELVGLAPTPQADHALVAYQHEVADAMAGWATGTTLASFADPLIDAPRLFDPRTRERLRKIKRRYDPAGVLHASFPYPDRSGPQRPPEGWGAPRTDHDPPGLNRSGA